MSTILSSVLALAGDKAASYSAAQAAVETASARTMLHGDVTLFTATLDALAVRKGPTAKRIHSFLLSACEEARDLAATVRPERKGKPTAEQAHTAATLAAQLAERFIGAIQSDETAYKEKLAAARKESAEKKGQQQATANAIADAVRKEAEQQAAATLAQAEQKASTMVAQAADEVAAAAIAARSPLSVYDVSALLELVEQGDPDAIAAARLIAVTLATLPEEKVGPAIHAH